MGLRTILRFPGTAFPAQALIGDDVLDAYLKKLDSRLIGSAKIRLLTLAEIKDHLLEHKATLLKTGDYRDSEASRITVEKMESVDAYSSVRNKRLFNRFSSVALIVGTTFALSMLGVIFLTIKILHGLSWDCFTCILRHGSMVVIPSGLLAGLCTGWSIFIMPEQRLPTSNTQESCFSVGPTKNERILSRIILPLFCLIALAFFIQGLLSISDGWAYICIAALYFANLLLFRPLTFSYDVDEGGISIVSIIGKRRRIPWKNLAGAGTLGEVHQWIPSWNRWRNVRFVDYISNKDRKKRLHIFPNMLNADRMFLLVRDMLEERGVESRSGTGRATPCLD